MNMKKATLAFLLSTFALPVLAADAPSEPRSDWTVTGTLWDSGPYHYDDSGHVASIGTDVYRYDKVGRLHIATAGTVPPPPGQLPANEQEFEYDRYGNLLSIGMKTAAGPMRYDFAVDDDTNQLELECDSVNACFTGFYDAATGNQLGRAGNGEYVWDALGMLAELRTSRSERYVYDADGERILVIDNTTGDERYTLRDSANRLARVLSRTGANNTWKHDQDYVYRGATLIASFSGAGTTLDRHYHVDHLGSTRLVTDASGYRLAIHTYWPFGPEAAGSETDTERLKFTGHERDSSPGTSPGSDLDYMHARYYDANAGRFLSVDPGKDWNPAQPQSWNLYAYVRNNPLNLVDPDGRRSDSPRNDCRGVTSGPCAAAMKNWLNPKFGQVDRIFWRAMGKLSLVAVSAAILPARVLAGAAGVGATVNATRESQKPDATPETIAGGAIDGAANGVIVRAGKNLADAAVGTESKDKNARDDLVSGLGSALLGNDLAIILGLAPLPPEPEQDSSGGDLDEKPKKLTDEEKNQKNQ
jgi:RHS repeat-associated protein